MALIDILRPKRRARARSAPQTTGETFWINFVKAIGRSMGGPVGRALAQKKRARRKWFWER